ncbi:MAG: Hpt domain-containing protein [Deltaproteobacteria bacterium]|nr:Hpt domain-containing protein [Deltaproteobacteria bacterium]
MTVTVDRDSIRENFMDDEELIFESIDMFFDSSQTRLKALQEAVKERDDNKIMNEAHALKGVVGIFSQGEVFDAAKKIEFIGRNKDLTGVDEALKQFETSLGELIADLKKWRDGD